MTVNLKFKHIRDEIPSNGQDVVYMKPCTYAGNDLYELLSCNTKEEAKLYAKEFILDMLKNDIRKYIISSLLARYRYLIRYFYILKDY